MDGIYPIFFSSSSKMNRIKDVIDEIAKTDITVLINGESGTGKELVAQTIHLSSPRSEKSFIKVNCAAIPRGLLESELFGLEQGAFTGTHLKKPGKFEIANGGTLLLNDLGETDISIQAKLLQVLEYGRFSRLGGEGDIKVDTRIIVTTKDHLEKSMMAGHFQEDLFFRINVLSITLPPLRDRREQILPLSEHFLDMYKTKYGRSTTSLSPEMMNFFNGYHWPGNIRELENVIRRIVLLGDEEMAVQGLISGHGNGKLDFLSPEVLLPIQCNGEKRGSYLGQVGKDAGESAEREIIETALHRTHWNRREAAKLLHVSYKTMLHKIQKYHLERGSTSKNRWGGQDGRVAGSITRSGNGPDS
jgi:two-component system, NtrC family, response regulator AtoC